MEVTASRLSFLLFNWLSPLLSVGYTRPLQEEDLWDLPEYERISELLKEYYAAYARSAPKQPGKPGHALTRVLASMVYQPMLQSALLSLVYVCTQVALPVLLRMTVQSVDSRSAAGAGYAVGMALVVMLGSMANQHALHLCFRMAQRLRAVLISIVYRKSLAFPPGLLQNASAQAAEVNHNTGKIANLLTTDTGRVFDVLPLIHFLWAAPALIAISTIFLIWFLGPAALAGIFTLVALVPVQSLIAQRIGASKKKHSIATDERVRLLNELLNGVRVVKLNGWERAFAQRLLALRSKEDSAIAVENSWFAIQSALLIVAPVAAMVATFAAFTLSGRDQAAADSFAALAFFNVIRFPVNNLGNVVTSAVSLRVSLARIEDFLGPTLGYDSRLPKDGGCDGLSPSVIEAQPIVQLKDGTFVWPSDASSGEAFLLKEVTLTILPGTCMVLAGPVAGGKSSLLSSLLGEMPRMASSMQQDHTWHRSTGVRHGARLAYSAQVPWIIAGSLRENVLFGSAFDVERYRAVMGACGLWTDCGALSAGDLTIIGERGVTLSGGQKARVSLARAAYARPDLLLADDPLSALDAQTGDHVWQHLLGPHGLLQAWGVARIIVSHAASILPQADNLLVLHSGRVLFGPAPHDELVRQCRDTNSAPSSPSLAGIPCEASGKKSKGSVSPETFLRALASASFHAETGTEQQKIEETVTVDGALSSLGRSAKLAEKSDSMVMVEDRAIGSVSDSVFWSWYEAGGGLKWVSFLLLGFIVERLTYIGTDFWLAAWTTSQAVSAGQASVAAGSNSAVSVSPTSAGLSALHSLPPVDSETRLQFWLAAYFGWACCNAAAAFWRMSVYSRIATHAAKNIFVRSMWGMMRAPMIFFETTPLGRIVNRLSSDVDTVDSVLLLKISSSTASAFWISSALGVMIAVVPWMAVVLGPILAVYRTVQQYFQCSVRELQRLESLSRSPLQAHFGESLQGSTTLRAFGPMCVARFISTADALMDKNNRALLLYNSSSRWLGTRLENLGAVIILAVALLAWAAGQTGSGLAGGYAGLALLWSTNLIISFNFNAVFVTETEARMVAVERLRYYSEELDMESPLNAPGRPLPAELGCAIAAQDPKCPPCISHRLALTADQAKAEIMGSADDHQIDTRLTRVRGANTSSWPSNGVLSFENVSLRYRPGLPLALEDVTFATRAGEYVAVVGRTGSGKSTLAAAIFRLVDEPGLVSGIVRVDGIDLRSVGLSAIRGRKHGIAIIPQEPLVFTGTVRFNLDPQGLHCDEELWQALTGVRLHIKFKSSAHKHENANTVLNPMNLARTAELSTGTAQAERTVDDGLDTVLREDSLSQGERQLLCLARAVLAQPRILVLDEATASVDSATDLLMHAMVRSCFTSKGCSVLSIAHRLSSVVTADRVLVLENGRVAQFGSPAELVKDNAGTFSALIDAAGGAVSARLRSQALGHTGST